MYELVLSFLVNFFVLFGVVEPSVYFIYSSNTIRPLGSFDFLRAQGIYSKGHLPDDVRYFVWIELALAENSIDIADFSLGNGKDLAI